MQALLLKLNLIITQRYCVPLWILITPKQFVKAKALFKGCFIFLISVWMSVIQQVHKSMAICSCACGNFSNLITFSPG